MKIGDKGRQVISANVHCHGDAKIRGMQLNNIKKGILETLKDILEKTDIKLKTANSQTKNFIIAGDFNDDVRTVLTELNNEKVTHSELESAYDENSMFNTQNCFRKVYKNGKHQLEIV